MLDRRINRLSFWAVIAPLTVVSTLLDLAGLHLPLWLPTAAFCVMRLHDIGRTGKWVLLPMALQIIALIAISGHVPPHPISTVVFGISGATLLVIIWLGSDPGEPISNAWGGPQAPGFSFGRPA